MPMKAAIQLMITYLNKERDYEIYESELDSGI
jgi:hypothetical protein